MSAAAKFWGKDVESRVTAQEKFKFLNLTGGVPRYLEELNPALSSNQNIISGCFQKEGFFFNEFDRLFSDLFRKSSAGEYKRILELLSSKNLSSSQIAAGLKIVQGGGLTDKLDLLEKNGFISRDHTYDLKNKKISSLSKYRLCDNYCRFYLKFIKPNIEAIKAGTFADQGLDSSPSGIR